jgi:hypothetical protein
LAYGTERALGVEGGPYAIRQAAAERRLDVGHAVRHPGRRGVEVGGGLRGNQESDRGDLVGFELREDAPHSIGDRHRVHDIAGGGRAVQPIDGDRGGDREQRGEWQSDEDDHPTPDT